MYQFLEHFVKTVAQAYYLNAKEVVIENKKSGGFSMNMAMTTKKELHYCLLLKV